MRQSTLKTIGSYTKSVSQIKDKDFFGISHVTSKDVAGAFRSNTRLPVEQLGNKYHPLTTPRDKLENQEHEVDVTFGNLRLDIDNVVRKHGQYEPQNDRKLYDTSEIKQKYVPTDVTDRFKDEIDHRETDASEAPESIEVSNYKKPYKVGGIGAVYDLGEVLKVFKKPIGVEDLAKYSNKAPLTFNFTKPLFGDVPPEESSPTTITNVAIKSVLTSSGDRTKKPEQESKARKSEIIRPIINYDTIHDQIPLSELGPDSAEFNERLVESLKFDKSIDEKFDVEKEQKPLKNALQYLKDIRAKRVEPTAKGLKHRLENPNTYSMKPSIKLDSQGFRNYSDQVPNWSACRHVDILNHLKSSIVYHNYDILAINKPYGIASHIDAKGLNMNDLVQELATQMRIEKVYLAHRLDMSTTGILLFATSQKRANYLNKLFKSDQIKKTYWAITCGVPQEPHALIDIPIGQYKVAGKTRRCLVPEKLSDEKQLDKRFAEAKRAVTEYRVLNFTKYAALLEVKPRSGIQHQIRCHLSFGLNAQILGDHKYSHVEKVAPQKLPLPLLKALNLRQAKVRTLPMHLHAKSIVIPGAKANGETLFIDAPLPKHFVDNAKALKLSLETK